MITHLNVVIKWNFIIVETTAHSEVTPPQKRSSCGKIQNTFSVGRRGCKVNEDASVKKPSSFDLIKEPELGVSDVESFSEKCRGSKL